MCSCVACANSRHVLRLLGWQFCYRPCGLICSPPDVPIVRRQGGRRERTLLQLACKREDGQLVSERTVSQNKTTDRLYMGLVSRWGDGWSLGGADIWSQFLRVLCFTGYASENGASPYTLIFQLPLMMAISIGFLSPRGHHISRELKRKKLSSYSAWEGP